MMYLGLGTSDIVVDISPALEMLLALHLSILLASTYKKSADQEKVHRSLPPMLVGNTMEALDL